jgi:hypothetical protein
MLRAILLVGLSLTISFSAAAQDPGCAECTRIEERPTEISKNDCTKLGATELQLCQMEAQAIAIAAMQLSLSRALQEFEEDIVPGSTPKSDEDQWNKLRADIKEFENVYGIIFFRLLRK